MALHANMRIVEGTNQTDWGSQNAAKANATEILWRREHCERQPKSHWLAFAWCMLVPRLGKVDLRATTRAPLRRVQRWLMPSQDATYFGMKAQSVWPFECEHIPR